MKKRAERIKSSESPSVANLSEPDESSHATKRRELATMSSRMACEFEQASCKSKSKRLNALSCYPHIFENERREVVEHASGTLTKSEPEVTT